MGTAEKAFMCACFLFIQLLGFVLNYGLIWHERSAPEVKRTLINRLGSNICALSAVYSILSMNQVAAIVLHFDAPVWLCDAVSMLMQSVALSYLATSIISIILRYLYTNIFKSIGMLNDDLLYNFVTAATASLGAYFAVLVWFSGEHKGPLWHKCLTCPMPEEAKTSATKALVLKFLGATSIVVHLVLGARIWWHKRKMARTIGTAEIPMADAAMSGIAIVQDSFVDLATTVMVTIMVVAGTMVVAALNKLQPADHCMPYPLICLIAIESIFIKGIVFLRNKDMRGKVFVMYARRITLKSVE